MKHFIFFLLTVFGPLCCLAQDKPAAILRPYVDGGNRIEGLSLQVQASNQIVTFANGEDYAGSKMLPGYYRINVKAPPLPWVVTVVIKEQYAGSKNGFISEDYASLVSLRDEKTGNTIRLSGIPQVLLQSSNTVGENDYSIDMIVDPPFNMPSGKMLSFISFQLSYQ